MSRETFSIVGLILFLALGFFGEALGLRWYHVALLIAAFILFEWMIVRRREAEDAGDAQSGAPPIDQRPALRSFIFLGIAGTALAVIAFLGGGADPRPVQAFWGVVMLIGAAFSFYFAHQAWKGGGR